MPTVDANGASLHFEAAGTGAQTVVFLHGLFLSGLMWSAQMRALSPAYRCMALDFRGQGRSAVSLDGYDMDTLARDVAGVVARLGAPVHLAGAGMGGFVALRVAARRPELVRSLALVGTSAEPEPAEDVFRQRLMSQIGRVAGLRPVVGGLMRQLFGPAFLADPARAAERDAWRARLLANDRRGAARALRGVLERRDVSEALHRLRVPTLVMAGEEDAAVDPVRSQRLHAAIPGSRLLLVPGAGHSLPIEQPGATSEALRTVLDAAR